MSDGKSDNTLYENGIGWALMLVIFALLAWLFWSYYDTEVRNIIRWIRYGEMWLISWFVDGTHEIFYGGQLVNWQKGFDDAPKWDTQVLTRQHLSYFNALAMQPLKLIFVTLCGMAALWAMFKGPGTHYRHTLGLEGLIERQAENFPVISPIAKFDPREQPPRAPGTPVPAELPLFAEALGPEEWLAYYRIPVPDGVIDRVALKKAFMKQLGGRWRGANALPPHAQIMLAAFCLKASRKRDASDEMLGRLARCWDFKTGMKLRRDRKLLGEARKILRNKALAGKTLAAMNRHAFVTTAMIRALGFAREEGGVLAPAQFVWLRAHDRTLWYPLNNLGRQAFHMEAVGAMSHHRAEKMTRRPIPVAKLDDAIDSIIDYMSSGKARPIPSLDYSGSKKRGVKKAT